MKTVSLTQQEIEMISIGLNMRKNFIQTGDVTLSQENAVRFGGEYLTKIKGLTMDQMRLIIATEDLITKLLSTPAIADCNHSGML